MYADEFLAVLLQNWVGAAVLCAAHVVDENVTHEKVASVSLRRSDVLLHTTSYEMHMGRSWIGAGQISIEQFLDLLDPQNAAVRMVKVAYYSIGAVGIEPVVAMIATPGNVLALAMSAGELNREVDEEDLG